MITITNGQMTLTVPNSAYHSIYKAYGFHPIEDEKSVVTLADTFPTFEDKTPEEDIFVEKTEDSEEPNGDVEAESEEEVDLSEIPLSEMDFYQLCSYADQLGLDRRGLRSKRELRALIKNNI